jgi:subtilase family serine protease
VYTAPNDFTGGLCTGGTGYCSPASSGDALIFNAMASDGGACRQLSLSWHWEPEDLTENDTTFEEFAAQGQSFFAASGDNGSFPVFPYFYYPNEDAWVTAVGGTRLTTDGAGGPWESEIAWGGANNLCPEPAGSGGGVSPDHIDIPSYQQLSGVINSSNQGSTSYRNVPDVAMDADCNNFYCDQGSCSDAEGGTSYAAPRWAGFMALVNEDNLASGGSPQGLVNQTIYPLGVGSSYDNYFHDITVGDNFNSTNPDLYSAVTGYDLVTGWGSPNPNGWLIPFLGWWPAVDSIFF